MLKGGAPPATEPHTGLSIGFHARQMAPPPDVSSIGDKPMEQKESPMKKSEDRLAELFERAHRDPALKRELFSEPRAVGERFGIKFNDEEVQQFQKLGALSELAEEIKYGRLYPRPPIFYPIHVWEISELLDIFTRLIPGNIVTYPGPIFYPAPEFRKMSGFAARAYHPGWVTYPGDDPGGAAAEAGLAV